MRIIILVIGILCWMNQLNGQTNGPEVETLNVLGEPLENCCTEPLTGFYRDGFCQTGHTDHGTHVLCAVMTQDFLDFTSACGNDLQTPNPFYHFPGLKPGDKWCLCATRWMDAMRANAAPLIDLKATHQKMLEFTDLETFRKFELVK